MKTVHVNTSKSYDVIIDNGLIEKAGKLVLKACPKAEKIAVITDNIVDKLYADKITDSLIKNNLSVCKFVFENGESSKSISTFTDILNFLAENQITRSDAVIALGGGVVGDIAGFASSSFLRGINFIQIPTTLLAMVDSSVGGKTAVNLDSGKNLAGAFFQPDLVICDYSTLSTLPDSIFSDGCAEVIKYGIISDNEFFEFLNNNDIKENLEYVISRCVEIKADIVANDEHDTGVRQLLNLGHTFGHAIEKCSSYSISHGSAVSIGMVIAAKGAFLSDICDTDYSEKISEVLKKYKLPIKCEYNANELFEVTLSDKKRTGSYTNLVVPEKIGKCVLKKLPYENILEFIEKGLS